MYSFKYLPKFKVLQSPVTRSKLKAPSITTPDSVKMKRSRSGKSFGFRICASAKYRSFFCFDPSRNFFSGRVIVPRLDPGTQNIIYSPDGSISGVTNLEAQFPQGSCR
ncbi:hypothetical protein HU200_008005 [Digitaria exilis]|uniref:Uncharacterized protein n=1 Tax=Digitaria exilis TaxID=1010633 RepID=A0A835FNJ3_9POAL|nr:hypothetical protein HU200_008005 [Digitaria exilis]